MNSRPSAFACRPASSLETTGFEVKSNRLLVMSPSNSTLRFSGWKSWN